MLAAVRRSISWLVLPAILVACDLPASSPASPSPSPTSPAASEPTKLPGLLGTPGVLEHLEVDDLTPAHHGRTVRVHGWVAPGSIAQRQSPPSTRFTLVRGDGSLTVEHSGPLPDRFQERLEAIVTGTLADDGKVLHATDLVAKCPDDYSTLPSWPEHGGPR